MKSTLKSLVLLALMLLSACLAAALRPGLSLADQKPAIDLESMLPAAFGDWTELPQGQIQIIDPQQKASVEASYDQTLARTYINPRGYIIMLSVAYGKSQRGALQLHHPELCYPAQGFEVKSNHAGTLSTPYGTVPVRRLETQLNTERTEPLTYWALVGDQVVLGSVQRKLVEMRYGLRGLVADGLLFRISSIDAAPSNGFDQQAAFIAALFAAMPSAARQRIAGI